MFFLIGQFWNFFGNSSFSTLFKCIPRNPKSTLWEPPCSVDDVAMPHYHAHFLLIGRFWNFFWKFIIFDAFQTYTKKSKIDLMRASLQCWWRHNASLPRALSPDRPILDFFGSSSFSTLFKRIPRNPKSTLWEPPCLVDDVIRPKIAILTPGHRFFSSASERFEIYIKFGVYSTWFHVVCGGGGEVNPL